MTRRRDPYEEHTQGRTEPTLGDLSSLDTDTDTAGPDTSVFASADERLAPAPPPAPRRRRGWLLALTLLVLGALVAVAWLNQATLRNMVPRTELNDVLGRAQQALQQGHLVGTDGTSARELFQAVLAMQPDNDAANKGLQQVGRALVAEANASLQAGHVDQAAQQAAQARELLGGGSELDQLDRRIQAARSPGPATPDLVARAQQALAAGNLDGPQGAAALYEEIARADPGSAVARHGLDQVGAALATRAQQALDAHDAATAGALIQQLAALQPSNGALPALRAAQAQMQAAAVPAAGASAAANQVAGNAGADNEMTGNAVAGVPAQAPAASPPPVPPSPPQRAPDRHALDEQIAQGQAALRAGRISGSGSDTALAHFKAALELDPDNAQARAGLDAVAQALAVQANAAMDAGDPAQAKGLLAQALALAPGSGPVAAALARLGNGGGAAPADASGDTAGGDTDGSDAAAMAAPMALSPQQRATIADLVRKAQAATQRGDIMMPPGDCAYDLYRSALAINGNDPAALQGLHDLPAKVIAQFQQGIASGNLARADDMLANYVALVPDGGDRATLAARLLSAWLDQAQRQLAQGDRAGAAQSLYRARQLAPNDPRLEQLSAQLGS